MERRPYSELDTIRINQFFQKNFNVTRNYPRGHLFIKDGDHIFYGSNIFNAKKCFKLVRNIVI